eukprot:1834076-Alexandrium_andersonii.AAC.1
MKQLDAARGLLGAEAPKHQVHFGTRVLGGQWTLAHKGVAFDAIQGYAKGASCEQFCVRRGLARSASVSCQEFGQEASGIMARAWAHKLEHFYMLECEHSVGDSVKVTPD